MATFFFPSITLAFKISTTNSVPDVTTLNKRGFEKPKEKILLQFLTMSMRLNKLKGQKQNKEKKATSNHDSS